MSMVDVIKSSKIKKSKMALKQGETQQLQHFHGAHCTDEWLKE
jgi:hypothetical protein